MSERDGPTRINIRLDHRDPLGGVVESTQREPRSFAGWLGLLSALEAMLKPAVADDPSKRGMP